MVTEFISSGTSPSVLQDSKGPARISLLYVDDEPDQLSLCKFFLEQSGDFQVETAISPRIALEKLPLSDYRVIVSDYQMPEMNGVEFLAEIERTYGNRPFVLFTGMNREEVISPGMRARVEYYVQKTGNARVQYAALGQVVKKAASRQKEVSPRDPDPDKVNPCP